MKVKYILAILILGYIFTVLGALFKILHWMWAAEVLITGTVLKVVAGILGIWKLFSTKEFNDFLNK